MPTEASGLSGRYCVCSVPAKPQALSGSQARRVPSRAWDPPPALGLRCKGRVGPRRLAGAGRKAVRLRTLAGAARPDIRCKAGAPGARTWRRS